VYSQVQLRRRRSCELRTAIPLRQPSTGQGASTRAGAESNAPNGPLRQRQPELRRTDHRCAAVRGPWPSRDTSDLGDLGRFRESDRRQTLLALAIAGFAGFRV
jgi:hypothetical protein